MPGDERIRKLCAEVYGEYYAPHALTQTTKLFNLFRDPQLPKEKRTLIRSLLAGKVSAMRNLRHALESIFPGDEPLVKYRRELWYMAVFDGVGDSRDTVLHVKNVKAEAKTEGVDLEVLIPEVTYALSLAMRTLLVDKKFDMTLWGVEDYSSVN